MDTIADQQDDVRADPEMLDRLFESPDGWDSVLQKPDFDQIEQLTKFSKDPARERMAFANTALLADAFQISPDEATKMGDQFRRSYAQQILGNEEAAADDATFYSAVGQHRKVMKDQTAAINEMRKAVAESFFAGKADFATTYATARGAAGERIRKQDEDAVRIFFQQNWDMLSARGESLKKPIEQVAAYFAKSTEAWQKETPANQMAGVVAQNPFAGFADRTLDARATKERDAAIGALASLNEQDREFVIKLAAARNARPERGELAKGEVRMGRMGTEFARRAGNVFTRSITREKLETGKRDNAKDMRQQLGNKLDDALAGIADPTKGSNRMTEIALATFESVPRMLAWATTAGAVVDTGVVADELRSDLIENGVPAENADKLAMVGAVPYSALNFLEYKMLAGKLAPGLFKTLRGIADQQFKAVVKRAGVNIGAAWTTEMVAETGQDFMPAFVQEAASHLGMAPGRDWKKEKELYLEALPTTAGVIGLLSIIGGSNATFRDRAYGQELLRSDNLLRAAGWSEDHIAAANKMPTPEAAQAYLVEHWNEREASPGQVQAVRAINEEVAGMEEVLGRSITEEAKPLPADARILWQRPGDLGEGVPGVTGINMEERSASPEQLREEGFAVPAIPVDLPSGVYSLQEIQEAVVARGGAVEVTETGSTKYTPERAAAKRRVARNEQGGFTVFNREGQEIGRANSPEAAAMMLKRDAGIGAPGPDLSTPEAAMQARATATADLSNEGGPELASVFNLNQPNSPTVTTQRTMAGKASAPQVLDALADVLEAAGTRRGKIRFGRMGRKARKALGFYRVKQKIIRVKTANDISTAAHEVAHHLSDTIWGFGHHWNAKIVPADVRAELMKLGRDLYGSQNPAGGYAEEGFAEFTRLYVTDPDKAQALAPKTFAVFENKLFTANPDLKAALKEAQRRGMIFHRQGSVERAKQGIAEQEGRVEKVTAAAKEALRTASRKWIDAAAPIKRFVDIAAQESGKQVAQADDPFFNLTARRMTADSIVAYMAEHGMLDWGGNVVGKPLKDAFKLVKGKADEFVLYLWAKRAQVLWQTGRNPGLSEFDANYLATTFDSPQFQQAAQIVYDWNNGVLEYAAQASPDFREVVNKIRAADPGFYIPLFREFSAFDDRYQPGLAGKALVKRLKGSGRRITNPVESMLAQAKAVVLKAQQKAVLDQIIRLAERTPGLGDFATEIPQDQVAARVQGWEVAKEVQDALASGGAPLRKDQLDILQQQGMTFFLPAFQPKQNEAPVMSVWRDGQVKWYEMDPELYAALSGMDLYRLSPALDFFFGMPARAVRLGTTGLRASFSLVTNPLRDLKTLVMNSSASGSSRHMFGLWAASIRDSAVEAFTAGNVRSEWIDAMDRLGIEMSQSLGQDTRPLQRMASRLKRGGTWAVQDIGSHFDLLRNILQFPETAARLAEVRAVAEDLKWDPTMPLTPEIAAKLSVAGKQVTTDFSAAGETARKWNQVIPFFNAAIQGPRAHVIALKRDPVKFALRGLIYGTGLALANWWRNKDEDWWKEMSTKERYLFTYIPVGDQLLRIPRAFEVDGVFMALTEALADAWYNEEPDRVKEWFGEFGSKLTQIDMASGVPVPPMPVPVELIAEQLANRDFFFDTPIVARGEEFKAKEDQYGAFTSNAAIQAGKILGMSPRRIDHAIKSMFGPMGGDLAAIFGRGAKEGRERDAEASDIPVLGVLFQRGGQVSRSPQSIDRLYDAYEEAIKIQHAKDENESRDNRRVRLMLVDAVKTQAALNNIGKHVQDREKRAKLQALRIEVARRALEMKESGKINRHPNLSVLREAKRELRQMEEEAE